MYPNKHRNQRHATTHIGLARLRAGLLLGLIVWLGACTALPTGYSDFDPETDFNTFQTFAFLPEKTLLVASPNPVNPQLEPTLKVHILQA